MFGLFLRRLVGSLFLSFNRKVYFYVPLFRSARRFRRFFPFLFLTLFLVGFGWVAF